MEENTIFVLKQRSERHISGLKAAHYVSLYVPFIIAQTKH